MLTKKDIGKKIVMFREPTHHEWAGIGEIKIQCKIGEIITLNDFYEKMPSYHIKTSRGGWYPACCFKLYEQSYEIY